MVPTDFWESWKKKSNVKNTEIKEIDFYACNEFALWIDLRSHPDNNIQGGGLLLNNTLVTDLRLKIEVRRQTGESGNITCHMFVVADVLMEVTNSNLFLP